MLTWMFAAALAVSTATSAPVALAELDMPQPDQVMAVPPELRAQLQQQVIDGSGSRTIRLQRLMAFLFRDSGLGMEYAPEATYTVAQAYHTRKANCLTFTLLTIALAREAGLDAYGQEIGEVLAWHQEENTIYRTNHVNAGLALNSRRFTVDVAIEEVITLHPPKAITDRHLLALYYNNRAAELMARAPEAATPYMTTSLQLDPGYANSWNNAGVLQRHHGDLDAAERDYKQALKLDPVNASALFNLVILYQAAGDEARSQAYKRRLEKVRLKDPYYQYLLALGYEKQGDDRRALNYYQRAIRLYRGEHRFFFGLARAYAHLGDVNRARYALERANTLNQQDPHNLYQAKLDKLRKLAQ